MSLEGKSVVVTGGGIGIGRYIALGCAARGAHVTVGDIDEGRLDETQTMLDGIGAGSLTLRTDVRVEADAKALMDSAADRFGGVDYLVNNAAIVTHFVWGIPNWPKIRDMEFEFFRNIFAVNVFGIFLCTKYALPYMEAQRSGHIVNLYGGARPTTIGSLTYKATKNAGATLTRWLADEVREYNICVMSLSPGGAIATEWASEDARARFPGPESVGERFFAAADADMSLSGKLLDYVDGKFVPINMDTNLI